MSTAATLTPQRRSQPPRTEWMLLAPLAGLLVLVLWPGLYADFGRDDYFQRAFVRLLDSPWPLFVQDHFPVPAAVFRPLGFASMWWEAQLFPARYGWHYAVQMALHLTTALVLWRCLHALAVRPLPALIASAAWALHPVAVGTTLWWSARFDSLATLGILLAVLGALHWRTRGGLPALIGTVLAALAAMLSKEIGLLAVPAILALWWGTACPPERRRARWLASAAVIGTALLYLSWRALVLGTGGSGLVGDGALFDTVLRGLLTWVQQAPGYFSYAAGGTALSLLLLGGGLLLMLIRRARRAPHQRGAGRAGAVLAAVALVLLPAVLQAPVAALNAAPLVAGMSPVEAAMQSRLYLLGLAGWALLLGMLLDAAWSGARPIPRALAASLLLAGTGGWGWISHTLAVQYAERTRANALPAHAALAALEQVALPAQRCHLRYTGLTPPPEWDVYVSMDSVLKALAPDAQLQALARCWVWSDWPTWFHVVAASTTPADALPATPRLHDGQPIAWLQVGSAAYAYLAAQRAAEMSTGPHWHWTGQSFQAVVSPPNAALSEATPP